ncbi:DMT family transporter [Sinomicrobium weinanense]|uniref:EamA family transporter n=1 Tax=Sinomicrobium weinanense TaxID=2842200 RepID=A0A926JP29_9FLAO|nr:DMT family transporter [Sinomicrobium weinanense]MBC9794667.1 EamA family transporter [Sinomicrobium weinanense]MBU3124152.1 DMT family transporter [Sinomicrobium weinanense]
MNSGKNNKWLLLSLLALIWGSSFILIKLGLKGLTPIELGSFRILFAALFLMAAGFKSLKHIKRHQWKYIVITAILATFIPAYSFAIAQTEIDSSVTAILNSLVPLNALLLGILFFKAGFQKMQVIGVFIGLLGSVLLIYNGAMMHPDQNYFFAGFIILATICYALNANILKRHLEDLSSLSIVTGNFLVLSVPALAILLFSGILGHINTPETLTSIGFIFVLGIIGTGIANILFFRLIQISSPVFATSVTYLIPVVAFIWGFLDHEKMNAQQLLGAAIVLVGVYLSGRKVASKKAKAVFGKKFS